MVVHVVWVCTDEGWESIEFNDLNNACQFASTVHSGVVQIDRFFFKPFVKDDVFYV